MTDPYRISEAPAVEPGRHAGPRGGLLRPVLWLVLIVSAAANAVTSTIGVSEFVGMGFGLVTLGCAATLVVHHYRRQRG
jgi:hypothetical protein